MNDQRFQSQAPTSSADLREPEGMWSKTVSFLKRDVKSFLRTSNRDGLGRNLDEDDGESGSTAPPLIPVESLVDFGRLPDLAFRREVLDWRDNFHANVTSCVARLHDAFIDQVQTELANTSLLRMLVARPADEVLQEYFVEIVRLPLISALRKEEAKLNAMASKSGLFTKVHVVFDIGRLNAECACLHDLGFRPPNKALIFSRVQTLLLGPASVTEHFRDQGMHISLKLLQAREPF